MAISLPSDIRESIVRLIEVCRDTQHGFELAARGVVHEPILRAELLQYSGQRQEFVADLNDALRRVGEAPIHQNSPTTDPAPIAVRSDAGAATDKPASTSGNAIDSEDLDFARLEQAVAAQDRVAILTECERAEAAAADAYREVAVRLPAALSGAVAVQLHAITRVHDRVQSLIDIATGDAGNN